MTDATRVESFDERIKRLGLSKYSKLLLRFANYTVDAQYRTPPCTYADLQRMDENAATQLELLKLTGDKAAYIAAMQAQDKEFPPSIEFFVNRVDELEACATFYVQQPCSLDIVRVMASRAVQFKPLPNEHQVSVGYSFMITNDTLGIPAAVVYKKQGFWRFKRSYMHRPTALFEAWSVETIIRFNDERLEWIALGNKVMPSI